MTDARNVQFTLAPSLDVSALSADYARTGRVSIDPFLAPAAADALRAHLLARDDWLRVMNAGDKIFEMPRAAHAALDAAQRATLDARIADAAIRGFQYRYETIRTADDPGDRGASLLDRFTDFMSSAAVIDLLRAVTGAPMDYADAQATLYGPGDFLTRHDDDVAGKRRHAAYILGLTPDWRTEWGGLLLFHATDETIAHGFAPAFNALRLFGVPALHSVSPVWPHAPHPRLSVTGWLRSR